jgi:peptidoglycan/LPS O-acetylase OafA/YrhL
VYLVVLYHAGVLRFSGGFIGVDVFFVLSGYLVTQVLLQDLRGSGSIRFWRFYSRRIRRLLPAAGAALIVTALVFTVIASPAEVAGTTGGLRAAAMYFANWFFIHQSTDCFGGNIQSSPVIHFWSLSVEEQFYAAWPLLLSGLYLVTRRFGAHRWRAIQVTILAAGLASLGLAVALSDRYLSRAYYGTDTRAYQLLAGALLACSPGAISWAGARVGRHLWWVALAAIGAVVLLGTSLIDVWPIGRGALVTVATVALIVSIEAREGIVRSTLSTSPMVYLGRVSYGTYLWHWPVILVATAGFHPGPRSLALISALVATGIASLSFQILERPIREHRSLDSRRTGVVAIGLATSLLLGVVVLPRITEADQGPSAATVAEGPVDGSAFVPANLDWKQVLADKPHFASCSASDPQRCTIVHGSGPKVLLIGDSNAAMYIPMLTKVARSEHLTLAAATAPACPWVRGLQFTEDPRTCRSHQEDWYGAIVPVLDPDIVVLVNRAIADPANPAHLVSHSEPLRPGRPSYLRTLYDRINGTVHRLVEDGRKVVMIEAVPVSTKEGDPLACLSKASYLDECRFVATDGPTPIERLQRAIAKRNEGQVWSLDLDRQTCPYLPICDPIVRGLVVRRDPTHLAAKFTASLAPAFERFLDDDRILQ